MEIKLSNEKLRYLSLFEKLTDVTPKDVVETESNDRLTYVVEEQDMGKAIGENGKNIRKVRNNVDKKVHVVQYSDDFEEFLNNIFAPVELEEVKIEEKDGKKIATIEVEESDKGRAVGKDGWNIDRVRMLADRHHGISSVHFA